MPVLTLARPCPSMDREQSESPFHWSCDESSPASCLTSLASFTHKHFSSAANSSVGLRCRPERDTNTTIASRIGRAIAHQYPTLSHSGHKVAMTLANSHQDKIRLAGPPAMPDWSAPVSKPFAPFLDLSNIPRQSAPSSSATGSAARATAFTL